MNYEVKKYKRKSALYKKRLTVYESIFEVFIVLKSLGTAEDGAFKINRVINIPILIAQA